MTRKLFEFKTPSGISSWSSSAKVDRVFLLILTTWIVPVIFALIISMVFFNRLPDEVPLFYSRIWGESQLATKQFLFLPTLGVILLGSFNFAVAVSFHSRDRVLAYLLAGAMALVSILSTITIFNIIRLVA